MQQMTPLKAIRLNCLDCMGGNANEVKLCPMDGKCSLYPYRFGHNPSRAGVGNHSAKLPPRSGLADDSTEVV